MNEVYISCMGVPEPAWLPGLQKFALTVLQKMNKNNWEVSILLCNDEFIKELNNKYRNINNPTDVLSFRQYEKCELEPEQMDNDESGKKIIAGDVVLSLETIKFNAQQYSIPFDQELKRLIIHGFLHLQGLDHESEPDVMLDLQENILLQLKEEKIV
jgi:probable rRNA maturation factor